MKYLVIGLGVFGRHLSRNLSQLGAEVIGLDPREENVSAIKDDVSTAVSVSFDDPGVLSRFPVSDFEAVILAIGDDFEGSMAFTMKAQELGAKKLICRVLSPMHERLLRLLKVERLVVPEEFAARGLAHSMLLRGAVDGIDLGSGHALVEVAIPKNLIGGSIKREAELFRKHDIRLVTIKRPDRGPLNTLLAAATRGEIPVRTLGTVGVDDIFKAQDTLVFFGSEKNLRTFLDEASGE